MAAGAKMSESPSPNFQEEDLYEASPEPYNRQRNGHATPISTSTSPSPTASTSSDKENNSRHTTREKGKGKSAMPPPKLPTPLPDSERAGKRKRTEDRDPAFVAQPRRRRTVEPQDDELDEFDEAYDPDQSIEERRRVRKELRDLGKDLNDNRAEYLNPNSNGIIDVLTRANEIVDSVKQTADATVDSRVIVTAADLSYRKTVQLTLGESVQGVDVDEFVSKCISFMRRGERDDLDSTQVPTSNTQRRRQRQHPDDGLEDSNGDDGDMLNWDHLGRFACLKHNARPSVPGFLLGPLSLEKRTRKPVQRNQGLKHSHLKQTQPEVVSPDEVEKNENANLTVLCTRILGRLKKVQRDGQTGVEREANDDMSDAEVRALMEKHGVHDQGGVDLFRFVVNPYSFGQTVENMFYVSFLIRDGKAGITVDDNGLLAVEATEPRKRNGHSQKGDSKHQAVLAVDMATWKELIEVFDIREPMIPHREEEVQVDTGGRGWYA